MKSVLFLLSTPSSRGTSTMPVTPAALQLVLDRSCANDSLGAAIRQAMEVIDEVLDDYG
jgi:hypothetical protein